MIQQDQTLIQVPFLRRQHQQNRNVRPYCKLLSISLFRTHTKKNFEKFPLRTILVYGTNHKQVYHKRTIHQ